MLKSGKTLELLLMIWTSAVIIYFLYRARTKPTKIRHLDALDSIDDIVGQAAEMGRPVLYHCGTWSGWGALQSLAAPMIVAAYSIMGYTAQKCAELGAPFIHTTAWPETVPLCQDIVEKAYSDAGKLDQYNANDMVRFMAPLQSSYTCSTLKLMNDQKVYAHMLVGPVYAECMNFLEMADAMGCVQFTGTARTTQIPWMATFGELSLGGTLIFEEMYAAGAALSGDPTQLGTIQGQDWSRFVILGLMGLGFIATLITGTSIVAEWMKI